MTKLRTHYDNLKVARDAPDAVIRAAYKVLVQKYHPDKNPGDARAVRVMQLINQSYDVLSDPAQRKEHDEWIHAQELLQAAEALRKARSEAPKPQSRPEYAWAAPPSPAASTSWNVQPHMDSTVRDKWKERSLSFLISPPGVMSVLLVVLAVVGSISNLAAPDGPPPAGPKPYQAEAPAPPAPEPAKPAYVRPATAPNGSQWPERAGYVKGYPIDNRDGRSEVTVDNTRNDAGVFAKLVSLAGPTAYPVRQFYIPAGAKFTMNKVDAGQYDLRYRDLRTGALSRSESFEVEERRTATGVEYSSLTLTLYKVQGGNFQTYGLAADEF